MLIIIVVAVLLVCTSFARARLFGAHVVPGTLSADMAIADCGGCS